MSKFDNIPYIPHFAIITEDVKTIHHEGDERSRTNPGHGYPAYDETIESVNYEHFTDRFKWEQRIKHLVSQKTRFRAFESKPVYVEINVSVKINDLYS